MIYCHEHALTFTDVVAHIYTDTLNSQDVVIGVYTGDTELHAAKAWCGWGRRLIDAVCIYVRQTLRV